MVRTSFRTLHPVRLADRGRLHGGLRPASQRAAVLDATFCKAPNNELGPHFERNQLAASIKKGFKTGPQCNIHS